jgi:hypothetical protein
MTHIFPTLLHTPTSTTVFIHSIGHSSVLNIILAINWFKVKSKISADLNKYTHCDHKYERTPAYATKRTICVFVSIEWTGEKKPSSWIIVGVVWWRVKDLSSVIEGTPRLRRALRNRFPWEE